AGRAEHRWTTREEMPVECVECPREDGADQDAERSHREQRSENRPELRGPVRPQPSPSAPGCLQADRPDHEPPLRWNSKRLMIRCATTFVPNVITSRIRPR